MKKWGLYIFALALFASVGCKKQETFPIEPQISFKSLVKNYNDQGKLESVDLKFEFMDGDGDIGLKQNDVSEPYSLNSKYYHNLIIDYLQFDKASGKYVYVYPASPVEGDTARVQFNARIPYIVPSGKNKALKGEITQNISTFGWGEKVILEFYIYDRSLHKSNVEKTPVIESN